MLNNYNTFNTPNLEDGRFLEGSNNAGTFRSAGAPNVDGWVKTANENDEWNTGAFTSSTSDKAPSGTGGGRDGRRVYFSLQRVNNIYGNSSTIQPKSMTVRYIIRGV